MQSSAIVMSYKGAASGKLLDSIITVAQAKLTEIELKRSVKKRVFGVLVEVLQNIHHHFNNTNIYSNISDEDNSIMFVFAKKNGVYSVTTGNYIVDTEIESLKKRLEEINGMDSDQVKEKYRQILKTGKISAKGGAGLGIIDIARKSGSKLQYEFRKYNDRLSFFSLTVTISV